MPPPSPSPSGDDDRAAAGLARVSRGLTLSIAAGALLYVAFGAWSGLRQTGERLATFHAGHFVAGLALASLNYGLRFAKWEVFLRRLGIRIAPGRSLAIFLSGFSLTVTPGKVGEVLKSYLLRLSDGIPMARTSPIVLAERITDLVACLLLVFLGAASFGLSDTVVFVCAAGLLLVLSLVLPVVFPRLGEWLIDAFERVPGPGRFAPTLREFHDATREVLAPAPFLATLALSVVAWSAECACFYVIVNGFGHGFADGFADGLRDGAASLGPSLLLCTFIYALTTVGGALSFLPGGLGVQEGGMVGLLIAAGGAIDRPTAAAATILTRLATLWYAVLLGVLALLLLQRALRRRPVAERHD